MRQERHQPLNFSLGSSSPEPEAGPPVSARPAVDEGSEAADLRLNREELSFPPPPRPTSTVSPYFADPVATEDAPRSAEGKPELRKSPPPAAKPKAGKIKASKTKPSEVAPASLQPDRPDASKSRPSRGRTPAPARYAYWVAGACAALWAGGFLAFVTGFGKLGSFDYAPFRDVVVAGLAVLPALFMLLFAYALRQGATLGRDVRTTRRLSEDLIGPAALSAARTGDLMRSLRSEIEQAAQAAEAAEQRLSGLRDHICDESRRLTDAALQVQTARRSSRRRSNSSARGSRYRGSKGRWRPGRRTRRRIGELRPCHPGHGGREGRAGAQREGTSWSGGAWW